jgi:hypothetical protein
MTQLNPINRKPKAISRKRLIKNLGLFAPIKSMHKNGPNKKIGAVGFVMKLNEAKNPESSR